MKALRISRFVCGRTRDAVGRVRYLVDPDGEGEERAIPEVVVLRRWRQRRSPGWTFGGSRLSPTLWRALPVLLGPDPVTWRRFDPQSIEDLRAARNAALTAAGLKPPPAETVAALLDACTTDQLTALVNRHTELAADGRSGVPDLFLFTRSSRGTIGNGHFVEVKKPDEPVSSDQKEEHAFMVRLGLEVRVLRLIERHKTSVWRDPSCRTLQRQS